MKQLMDHSDHSDQQILNEMIVEKEAEEPYEFQNEKRKRSKREREIEVKAEEKVSKYRKHVEENIQLDKETIKEDIQIT